MTNRSLSEATERPDVKRVLGSLKDFQRDSVEYVFQRMFLDPDPARRFLIADEVGLGKTLVARGVVARAIDHLWEITDRIDIVYICSNSAIARQNVNRLRVTSQAEFALATRITLLPTQTSSLKGNKLNFVSFTPGTSFDLKSNLGTAEERALLYRLIRPVWDFFGDGPLKLLQGGVERTASFGERVRETDTPGEPGYQPIDVELADAFRSRLAEREDLRARFHELSLQFAPLQGYPLIDLARDRAALVGELRNLLARECIRAIQPDLIILDEFQRFKHLLDGSDAASRLAQDLFEYEDEQTKARVLLLSATPYKMYTLDHETGEDHYADFVRTVKFLEKGNEPAEDFERLLGEYRLELLRLANRDERLFSLKRSVEGRLRRVMVRTERLANTEDRDGMLVQAPLPTPQLQPSDLQAYTELQGIDRVLWEDDTLEYWKSAPYLLNFMEDYKIKRKLDARSGGLEPELARHLSRRGNLLLDPERIRSYREIDPANARLRALLADVVDSGAWKLLWIPPSLPYYQLGSPFSDVAGPGRTKRLIFSGWQVVPQMIASLVSYDVERRIFEAERAALRDRGPLENSPEARERRRPLLRFARSEGRLTGMPVLSLLYPCASLAKACDPLKLARQAPNAGRSLTVEEVLSAAEERIKPMLRGLHPPRRTTGGVDEAWYWAAPILLDLDDDQKKAEEWLGQSELAKAWSGVSEEDGQEESAWAAHVGEAVRLARRQLQLGEQPDDLAHVLALVSLAGWGTVALRALARVAGGPRLYWEPAVRIKAGQVASALRSLFNLPEAMSLVRALHPKEPYWQRVLEYSVAGGLQATLDEYAHVLRDSRGLLDQTTDEVSRQIAGEMQRAIGLRTATLRADEVKADSSSGRVTIQELKPGFRVRFALRFGDDRSEDERGVNRAEVVREAFNSPFWPFVLATTSVGQEGLDFHTYCHAVVHWNLPANPVDLEQREGRVHRYKGHAVRRNLALRYGKAAVVELAVDPWVNLFAKGKSGRPAEANDLVPYWVFHVEGGVQIERHVPALPLSREVDRLTALRKSLVLYRMVFGQARQEDLIDYLRTRLEPSEVEEFGARLRMDLAPPKQCG